MHQHFEAANRFAPRISRVSKQPGLGRSIDHIKHHLPSPKQRPGYARGPRAVAVHTERRAVYNHVMTGHGRRKVSGQSATVNVRLRTRSDVVYQLMHTPQRAPEYRYLGRLCQFGHGKRRRANSPPRSKKKDRGPVQRNTCLFAGFEHGLAVCGITYEPSVVIYDRVDACGFRRQGIEFIQQFGDRHLMRNGYVQSPESAHRPHARQATGYIPDPKRQIDIIQPHGPKRGVVQHR